MSLLTAAEQAAYNFNPKCTELQTGWSLLCENQVVQTRDQCKNDCVTAECETQCDVQFDLSLRTDFIEKALKVLKSTFKISNQNVPLPRTMLYRLPLSST